MGKVQTFVVAIPARFASTRLPGKPLQPIAGEPMIRHVARRALAAGAAEVAVATDDARVAEALSGLDVRVAMTHGGHASGSDRIAECADACGWPDETIVVNLQGDEPLAPASGIRAVADALAEGMAEMATLEPEVALRRFVENALDPEPEEALVERVLEHRVANPPDPAGWAAQAGIWASFDVWEELPAIGTPTLVVQGEGDVVVDPRNAALLAERIPGAELRLVAGGHLFFWNRPAEFVALLREFLGS